MTNNDPHKDWIDGGKRARFHRRHFHQHEKLGLIASIKRYGFLSAITYRIRKSRIPIWFWLSLIGLIIIPIIMVYYRIDFLSIIFYLLEIIVIGYLMFKLLKRLDRIYVGNDMRLFGLRMLSGIISGIGIYMSFIFLIFGMPIVMSGMNNLEATKTMYGFLGLSPFVSLFTFGMDFGLPLAGVILFISIALGMAIIGGYLFFKFQRRTGRFVWFGRI